MNTIETLQLNTLVTRAKAGDEAAFSEIYEQFSKKILKYIRLKIQNNQEAEDILQEVFIKAYNGMPKLSTEDLHFSAWLYRIASNTINDHFRKKYRTPEINLIDENFDLPSDVSLKKEMEIKSDWDSVRRAFGSLPTNYKQVLELRFLQDFSSDEVAKILHKSNLAVRLLQYRALKKVQNILSQYEHQHFTPVAA